MKLSLKDVATRVIFDVFSRIFYNEGLFEFLKVKYLISRSLRKTRLHVLLPQLLCIVCCVPARSSTVVEEGRFLSLATGPLLGMWEWSVLSSFPQCAFRYVSLVRILEFQMFSFKI